MFSNLISGWLFSLYHFHCRIWGNLLSFVRTLLHQSSRSLLWENATWKLLDMWNAVGFYSYNSTLMFFFSWSTLYIQNAHQVLLVWAKQLEGRNHQVIKKTQNVLTCVFWFIIIVWPVFWNVDVQSKYSKALEKTKMLLFITNSIL